MEVGEEQDHNYTYRCTITTRMTPALKWAAMKAILIFHSLWRTKSQDSVSRPQLLKRKESRSGFEPRSVWRWEKKKIIYLSLHCHHQNDSCIKMGSDESHFNVLLIVRDTVTTETVSTNHNLFEEKGELKRNRPEALMLTSLTPYR